jgi:hypothetical protein
MSCGMARTCPLTLACAYLVPPLSHHPVLNLSSLALHASSLSRLCWVLALTKQPCVCRVSAPPWRNLNRIPTHSLAIFSDLPQVLDNPLYVYTFETFSQPTGALTSLAEQSRRGPSRIIIRSQGNAHRALSKSRTLRHR